MSLLGEIKNLLSTYDLGADDYDAVLLDAQEYGVGEIIAAVSENLTEAQLQELEKMLEDEATVETIDSWLSQKVATQYEQHANNVISSVKEYLEAEDMGEEEGFEVEDEENYE